MFYTYISLSSLPSYTQYKLKDHNLMKLVINKGSHHRSYAKITVQNTNSLEHRWQAYFNNNYCMFFYLYGIILNLVYEACIEYILLKVNMCLSNHFPALLSGKRLGCCKMCLSKNLSIEIFTYIYLENHCKW